MQTENGTIHRDALFIIFERKKTRVRRKSIFNGWSSIGFEFPLRFVQQRKTDCSFFLYLNRSVCVSRVSARRALFSPFFLLFHLVCVHLPGISFITFFPFRCCCFFSKFILRRVFFLLRWNFYRKLSAKRARTQLIVFAGLLYYLLWRYALFLLCAVFFLRRRSVCAEAHILLCCVFFSLSIYFIELVMRFVLLRWRV